MGGERIVEDGKKGRKIRNADLLKCQKVFFFNTEPVVSREGSAKSISRRSQEWIPLSRLVVVGISGDSAQSISRRYQEGISRSVA